MKQLIQDILGKFGYAIRRTSTLHGYAPGSTTRPIAEIGLFLEDIRARGFVPNGIIDVGANKGHWTKMARSVFPKAKVLMIEPQAEMEEILGEIIRTEPECYYLKAGVGRENGELIQTIWPDSEGSSFLPPENPDLLKTNKQRKTKIVTLDSVLPQEYPKISPDLVKLDIQGFELEALSGAETLFGKTELFILEASLFRFMPNQPIVREVISFMSDRGYELYDVPGRCRRPIDGALGQVDLAFVKANGLFRKTSDW